ncbi:hypothetical protein [Streptomyces sp. TR02-1]|uniref:hypothetical protein n=1 Tax=Streptomyces sp. TR02-1 TaxID=3385977 RepID=UPI00399F91D7
MLHIKLREPKELDPTTCPMGRHYNGWHKDMSEQDVYDINRGRWVLGERADSERYALFAAEGVVRAAVEIHNISSSDGTGYADKDGRRILTGRVLTSDHPVHSTYVGKPSPADAWDKRNPIFYFNGEHDVRLCACGCGESVTHPSNNFMVGHDQRAIRQRVNSVGGPVAFMKWFDAAWKS